MADLIKHLIDPARDAALWTSTAELRGIDGFAKYLGLSPYALLFHSLAATAAHIPPSVTAADGGALNVAVGVVGETGDGKSMAMNYAESIVALPSAPSVYFGTWQFHCEYIWRHQREGHTNFPFMMDAGFGIYAMARGKARAKMLAILDGGDIERPKGRHLVAGTYRVTWQESISWVDAAIHFAPKNKDIADRFLYAWASGDVPLGERVILPTVTLPDWSGVTGRVTAPAHTLTANDPKRHKVAVLLAAMHGRTAVTDTDWDNAGITTEASDLLYADLAMRTAKGQRAL